MSFTPLAAIAAVVLLALAATAQEPSAATAPSSARARAAWPALDTEQRERAARIEHRLRALAKAEPGAESEARRRAAEDELAALGAGAAPFLLLKLNDQPDNINDSLTTVLDRVTAAEHAPLLAARAEDHRVAARRYVLRRLTELHVPDAAAVFRRARSDRDPEVAFQGGLGLLSIGDLAAMDEVFARCEANWPDVRARVEPALRGARGPEATAWVLRRIDGASDLAIVAGLRMLRSVADRGAVDRIKPHLASEDNSVRKAAINALRVLVDGAEPIEELSVFQVIEMANDWKRRV